MSNGKQEKKESDLKLIIVLTLVCAISGAVLTAVAKLTEEPIAKTKKEIKLGAIRGVLPEVANDLDKDMKSVKFEYNGKEETFNVYPGKDKDSNPVGYAVESVSHKGYAGDIEVTVGVLPDGSIKAIKIVKQNETPGLGTKVESEDFQKQFIGKTLSNFKFKVKRDGGDVDAITAATISSRAVSEALEKALKAVEALNKQESEK